MAERNWNRERDREREHYDKRLAEDVTERVSGVRDRTDRDPASTA